MEALATFRRKKHVFGRPRDESGRTEKAVWAVEDRMRIVLSALVIFLLAGAEVAQTRGAAPTALWEAASGVISTGKPTTSPEPDNTGYPDIGLNSVGYIDA